MKINCITRARIEYENGIESLDTAFEVDPEETVFALMDRLVGFNYNKSAYPLVIQRRHESSTVVELRVAVPKPKEEG